MTRNRTAAVVLLAVGATALAGCSSMTGQKTQTFKDAAAYAAEGPIPADWIPADATGLKVTVSTKVDGVGAILLTSPTALPGTCRDAERRSAPTVSVDGAPDVYDPKAAEAHVCGDWTVIAAPGGWYGWTPNVEDQG